MGAYVADIFSRILGKGVGEDAFETGVSKLEGSGAGRTFLNLTGNKDYEMSLHPGGEAIQKMNNDYIHLKAQHLDAEMKQINPASPAPVREMQMRQARSVSRLKALQGSYGSNYENVTPIIAGMLTHPDPRVVSNAHRLADIVSNQTHDTRVLTGFGKNTITKDEGSFAKASMNKAFSTANKMREELDMSKIPLLNTEKTYTKPSQVEYKANRIMNTMLIPFVALNHIGQLFHPIMDSPLPAVGKMLLRADQRDADQFIEASHIQATTLWNTMYRDILGETGKVSEWTGKPEVGKILARTIHTPGLNFVRKMQLNIAGTVGFHSAIYWAHNLVESGSKRAAAELSEMGIEPADVIKQKGQLSDDQLTKGVFHYVNNRFFVDREMDQSLWANKNVWTRSMFMYHSFVNSEAAYMRRTLIKMQQSGDIKGIAQFAGTLGLLWPNIAPLITGAQVMARTASVSQGAQETESRYKRLYKPTGAGDWFSNYAALLSHIGAAGVYFNYLNAIHAHRLVSAMAGPMFGAIGEDAEDVGNWATTENKKGEHPWKPVLRDALKQTIPVVGSSLAHHLAPTTAEEKAGGSSSRRISRFGSRRGRRRF